MRASFHLPAHIEKHTNTRRHTRWHDTKTTNSTPLHNHKTHTHAHALRTPGSDTIFFQCIRANSTRYYISACDLSCDDRCVRKFLGRKFRITSTRQTRQKIDNLLKIKIINDVNRSPWRAKGELTMVVRRQSETNGAAYLLFARSNVSRHPVFLLLCGCVCVWGAE